jgi:hypothetical protein
MTSLPNIYYITIATKPHLVLDNIKKTCEKNGEKIIVLGQQENRYIGWQNTGNFGIKLREVQTFVLGTHLNDDDIILFTDAYDIIYAGNQSEILERFLAFEKPIIFGAEKYCNPKPSLSSQYKFKDTEFPYLNSGMFIGYVHALRECISNYMYNDNHDDQLFWTLQFLNRPHLIGLDYQCSLFLNTYNIDNSRFSYNKVENHAKYREYNPLFVHVNGPDKVDLQFLLPEN